VPLKPQDSSLQESDILARRHLPALCRNPSTLSPRCLHGDYSCPDFPDSENVHVVWARPTVPRLPCLRALQALAGERPVFHLILGLDYGPATKWSFYSSLYLSGLLMYVLDYVRAIDPIVKWRTALISRCSWLVRHDQERAFLRGASGSTRI